MSKEPTTQAEFPEKLQFLFEPHRYKILYGGRGGAKSWGIARSLLIQAAEKPLRILCAREIQKSIDESVHQLLEDQVEALGLGGHYEVLKTEIKGINGSLFTFAGLKHNVDNIKSKEGLDRVWVEEADNVSKASWEKMIPTIRKDGSEIIISFNPNLEEDYTYQRFVMKPPSNAFVQKINWSDNPWFPAVLRQEMEDLKARDYDAFLNVWEGHCRQTLDGAIYAKELRRATEEGRITKVPYDPVKPVHTFWDLGWADNTSIWFAQAVGMEYRCIDYIEDSQKTINYYVNLIQNRGYVYGTHFIPHDGKAKQLGTGRSIEEILTGFGLRVQVVPRLSVADGINAARTIFANCWFDSEKCADGLSCLRRYRYEVDQETGQFSKLPLHDSASHGADAFRMLGVALMDQKPRAPSVPKLEPALTGQLGGRWLGR